MVVMVHDTFSDENNENDEDDEHDENNENRHTRAEEQILQIAGTGCDSIVQGQLGPCPTRSCGARRAAGDPRQVRRRSLIRPLIRGLRRSERHGCAQDIEEAR